MSSELMPGYRPLDTHITASPSGVNAEVPDRDVHIQKLMDIRENAERKIAEFTDRLNTDYYNKNYIAPEEDVTELEGWIDVAHQITWSLIRDLLSQQSLEIEKAYAQIADQAPVLSWFQKVTDFFRQIISKPHQSAETPKSPAAVKDSLTPNELASAKEALTDLYYTLEGVFCRLPNLRTNTALVRAILITSILFTLLPTVSAIAPVHSSSYDQAPPSAQVSEVAFPGHLSTTLHQTFAQSFPPLFTSHLATHHPTLPLEQDTNQPPDAPRVPNELSTNIEVAIEDVPQTTIGVSVQNAGLEQISAVADSGESMQINEVESVANVTPITDVETIQRLTDYIALSPVKIPDFNSPELAQLSDVMKRAISATNVAIVDTDRPDHLFAHGSLVADDQGNLSLHTLTHVVFNHLFTTEGNQTQIKNSDSLLLVISDDQGLHYYRFNPKVSDIVIDTKGKQDGLAMIKLQTDLVELGKSLPSIKPIPYSEFLNNYVTEGQPGVAYTFSSLHGFVPLLSQSGLVTEELGKLTAWTSSALGLTSPISTDGDSGRGISTAYGDECYLIGVTRGVANASDPNSILGFFDNSLMSYSY